MFRHHLSERQTWWKHQDVHGLIFLLCNEHSDARLRVHPDDDVELWACSTSDNHGPGAYRERRCQACDPRRIRPKLGRLPRLW